MPADRARKDLIHTDLSQEEPSLRADSFDFRFRFGFRGGSVGLTSHGPTTDLVASNIAYAITCVLAIGGAWVTASLGVPILAAGAVGLIVFVTGVAVSIRSSRNEPPVPTSSDTIADDQRRPRRRNRQKSINRKRNKRG